MMRQYYCVFVFSFVFALLCVSSLSANAGDENAGDEKVWNIEPTTAHWAREAGSLDIAIDSAVSCEGRPCVRAIHRGRQDWNFSYARPLKVVTGEVYEMTCPVLVEGEGVMGVSCIINAGEKIVMYGYGRVETGDTKGQWKTLKSTFVVPRGITTLHPRLTGIGNATVWFGPHRLRKLERRQIVESDKTWTLENERLKLTLSSNDLAFSVLDKKTNRLWTQVVSAGEFFPTAVRATRNELAIDAFWGANLQAFMFGIRLDANANEFVVTLDARDPAAPFEQLEWPYPFASRENDWIIIPMTEGFGIPATDPGPCRPWYGYSGLSMSFCAQVDEPGGAGWLAILETPDDAGVATSVFKDDKDTKPLLTIRPRWVAQRRTFGYKRSIRYSFFESGRHVAACKRYRQYAKETGLLVTFDEKIKRNPALANGLGRLRGAANIWYFGRKKSEVFDDLLTLKMDHILWSGGGDGETIARMNKSPHVLTSRYDIYQDLVDPALHSQLGGIPGSHLKGAWPKDLMWKDPDGTHTKGWKAPHKDPSKPRIPCDVLCDTKSLDYARRVVPDDLAKVPYTARFLDTTTSTPWRECWNPEHPMTRTDSRVWKMKLLALMGEEYNLVCGSETGRDASVPYCDFYEGMMSLGGYMIESDSKTLERFNDAPPKDVVKYAVNEYYRLPLWELVYHDCTVAYNWWYDFNNARAQIWHKRDLFNVLYGTPPIYRFDDKFWSAHKEEIAASYRVAEPVSLATGGVEMTDHRFLDSDRKVQETRFANGLSVIVNFGDTPWRADTGETVAPGTGLTRSVRTR